MAEPDVTFPYTSGGLVTVTVQLYDTPGVNDPDAIPNTDVDNDVTYVGGLEAPEPIVHAYVYDDAGNGREDGNVAFRFTGTDELVFAPTLDEITTPMTVP